MIKNDNPEGSRLPEKANILTSKYNLTSEFINPSVEASQEGLNMALPNIKTNPEELLKFHTILMKYTGGRRVPIPLEMHISGSKTGHNCSVDNGKLTCWRHYTVHNAFSYLAVLAGILPCERAGKEHGSSYFGVDMFDGETVYKVWSYVKLHGFIPEDDPIPWSALAYYAISKNVCEKKDIVDGKIPKIFSTIALMIAKKEGLNFGRVW